jgi:hypothetical protein
MAEDKLDEDNFACLPPDLLNSFLLEAWDHLDQREFYGIIPRVCRSWRQLSYAPSTIRSSSSIVVSPASKNSFRELLGRISKHGPILQQFHICFSRLSLLGWSPYSGHSITESLATSPSAGHLRSFTIKKCMHAVHLTHLSAFNQLIALTLSGCRLVLNPNELSNVSSLRSLDTSWSSVLITRNLIAPLQQLTSLNVIGNAIFPDDNTLEAVWALPQLQFLELGYCNLLTQTLSQLPASACKDLSVLSLGVQLREIAEELRTAQSQDASSILNAAPLQSLSSLDLTYYGETPWVKDQLSAFIYPLTTSAPKLRNLRLVGQEFWLGENASVLSALTQLTSLDLQVEGVLRVSEVSKMVKGLSPGLRELHLWGDELYSRDYQEELQQLREVCSSEHVKFNVKMCVA